MFHDAEQNTSAIQVTFNYMKQEILNNYKCYTLNFVKKNKNYDHNADRVRQ